VITYFPPEILSEILFLAVATDDGLFILVFAFAQPDFAIGILSHQSQPICVSIQWNVIFDLSLEKAAMVSGCVGQINEQ
jgi:hypothetical protein